MTAEQVKRRLDLILLGGSASGSSNADATRPPVEIPLDPLFLVDDDEQFIRELYWTVMGRSSEAKGLAHNLELLHEGVSRRSLVEAFVYSSEAQEQNVRFSPIPSGKDTPALIDELLDRLDAFQTILQQRPSTRIEIAPLQLTWPEHAPLNALEANLQRVLDQTVALRQGISQLAE